MDVDLLIDEDLQVDVYVMPGMDQIDFDEELEYHKVVEENEIDYQKFFSSKDQFSKEK